MEPFTLGTATSIARLEKKLSCRPFIAFVLTIIALSPFSLSSEQNFPQGQKIPPEQIEQELQDAEAQFENAQKLFNPWYTGPLLTPSASMIPPGMGMIQPYLFLTDVYGGFNEDRERISTPNQFTIQPQPIFLEVGVTPSVDTTVLFSTVANWKNGQCSGGINDMSLRIGFLINKESLWVPKAKFTIGQSFPTGKYENLKPANLGLDATGAGAYITTFSLAFGKLLFWNTLHPFNTRAAFTYGISTPVLVHGFNSYGGGYGTKGRAHPGNTFQADVGMELSINQPWVVALDLVYNYTNRTTFSGHQGTKTKNGPSEASVGSGYSDQFSLAPAIEYNFNDQMGLIWGAWFTVYGRNAANFVSGIFSWYWAFP